MFGDLLWLYIGLLVLLFVLALVVILVGAGRSRNINKANLDRLNRFPDRPNPAQGNTPVNPEVREKYSQTTSSGDLDRDRA